MRTSGANPAIDVYLYDALSSGAGYSSSVANDLNSILDEADKLLRNCNCQSACQNCLMHFRNQRVHSELDRFAGLQLLRWARYGETANMPTYEEQAAYIRSLETILETDGIKVNYDSIDKKIILSQSGKTLQAIVYPGMLVIPPKKGVLYVNEALLKYAKPYALKQIENGFKPS